MRQAASCNGGLAATESYVNRELNGRNVLLLRQ
jgi:hypothetical protein